MKFHHIKAIQKIVMELGFHCWKRVLREDLESEDLNLSLALYTKHHKNIDQRNWHSTVKVQKPLWSWDNTVESGFR